MQIRNLRVFCDVVARHSFSKAAADNDMTQSGASQAVQQLEEYLQVQLIDRSKRPFVLTTEGQMFHTGCLKILRSFESLADEVRSIGNEVEGKTSIASIYSVGLSYLPDIQKSVSEQFPKVQVRFQFGHPDEVYRLVEQGIVDFGLVSYPKPSKTVTSTGWREERMILASTDNHPLVESSKVLPSDLASESLVAFAPHLRIRHEIDRYLRQLGITMQIAAELDNIDSVRHAMDVNLAVAFLPEPSVREDLEKGSVVALKCPWLDLTRPLGIVQRRSDSLCRTAREVMELIRCSGIGCGENAELAHSGRNGKATAQEVAGQKLGNPLTFDAGL
ncbi:MAG: LysR family transcriptional regulator [Aureliella sp.]